MCDNVFEKTSIRFCTHDIIEQYKIGTNKMRTMCESVADSELLVAEDTGATF